jgi:hypothetical protein
MEDAIAAPTLAESEPVAGNRQWAISRALEGVVAAVEGGAAAEAMAHGGSGAPEGEPAPGDARHEDEAAVESILRGIVTEAALDGARADAFSGCAADSSDGANGLGRI